jgi:hypothetical protein
MLERLRAHPKLAAESRTTTLKQSTLPHLFGARLRNLLARKPQLVDFAALRVISKASSFISFNLAKNFSF